jgi:hypothetical protein
MRNAAAKLLKITARRGKITCLKTKATAVQALAATPIL